MLRNPAWFSRVQVDIVPLHKKSISAGQPPEHWSDGRGVPEKSPCNGPPAPRAHHHPREQPQPQPGRHSCSRVFCRCVSFPAPQGSPGHPSPPMAKPSPGWDHQPRAVRCTLPIRTPGVPAVPIGHQSDDTADVVTMPKRWNRPCAQGPCLEVTGCHPAARRQAAF